MIETNLNQTIRKAGVENLLEELRSKISSHAELIFKNAIVEIQNDIQTPGIYFNNQGILLVQDIQLGGMYITGCHAHSVQDNKLLEIKLRELESKYSRKRHYLEVA